MPVIDVNHIHKRYGGQVAVRDVSFSVEQGEVFGLLGPNGAGKTTTVECIAGLRTPDGGRITVVGLDPRRDRAALRHCLGVQLQQSALPEKLTVGEALELYRSFYRTPANAQQLLETLGLAPQRTTRFAQLSGGQKQRLFIALALIGRPQVAILDELTTGLDPQARRDTWALIEDIRDQGVTILLVTHFMEEAARLCDRVAVLDAGRVVALDSPAAVTARIGSTQRLRFHPSRPFDERLLTDLPAVTNLSRVGQQVLVTGHDDVLAAVTTVLARAGVVAEHLRVEQVSLEDAVVALTGRSARAREPEGASAVPSLS